jgi:hypothetical protein
MMFDDEIAINTIFATVLSVTRKREARRKGRGRRPTRGRHSTVLTVPREVPRLPLLLMLVGLAVILPQ